MNDNKYNKALRITDDYWEVDLRPEIEKLRLNMDTESKDEPSPSRCDKCDIDNYCIRINVSTGERVSYCEDCCICGLKEKES